MNLILRKTKSNDRFQKMRSIYLGSTEQKHKTTGYYGQRDKSFISWGFNQKILREYIEPYIYRFINKGGYIKEVTLIDDFTFEATNYFIDKFKATKITCAFIIKDDKDKENIKEWFEEFIGLDQIKIIWIKEKEYKMPKLNKQGLPLLDKKTGEQKYIINKEWDLGGLKNMECNLIISNPAYGSIGANITDVIKTYVDYKEFINLLPANDYKRNDHKDLFKYQSDMKVITDGFIGDAVVTTHVARIHKGTKEDPAPNIDMTEDEFEISQYIDKSLDKYFEENSKRNHYAIDNPDCGKRPDLWELGKTFVIGFRDMNHKHLPYKKTSATYLWNVLKNITWKYFVENFNNPRADRKGTYEVSFYGIKFRTEQEFKNFVDFIYSKNGFRFMSKVFTALNVDSFIALNKFMPKVDWTRSWTVEEILRDYGYTEEEILEVMADLDNFKGMDD